jgi:hypothetical protein
MSVLNWIIYQIRFCAWTGILFRAEGWAHCLVSCRSRLSVPTRTFIPAPGQRRPNCCWFLVRVLLCAANLSSRSSSVAAAGFLLLAPARHSVQFSCASKLFFSATGSAGSWALWFSFCCCTDWLFTAAVLIIGGSRFFCWVVGLKDSSFFSACCGLLIIYQTHT